MKIALIIPTRKRPQKLFAVLHAFDSLSSDENDIKAFVRYDSDDIETDIFINGYNGTTLNIPVSFLCLKAPPVVAQKAIDVIESEDFKNFNPDVYVLLSDDMIPLTPHYDMVMCEHILAGKKLFCWQEVYDPNNPTYIIMSKEYAQALPSYLPTWFPFWFVDAWATEVYHFAYGNPPEIITELKLCGRRGKTRGMKDVAFWFFFFSKTRKLRLEEARIVREKLQIEGCDLTAIISGYEAWDKGHAERCDLYEASFGGLKDAPFYDDAMSKAKLFLKESGL